MTARPEEITQLLIAWNRGDERARDELIPLIYNELRRLARGYMRRERPDHTLQATALVNEAYLRLVDQSLVSWQNRAHFYGIAARLMRQILVNHAEARRAAKRGGAARRVSLGEVVLISDGRSEEVLALDEALGRLSAMDERKGRIVELRYFSGLSIEEIAEVMGVSAVTIKREWVKAKAWLFRELSPEDCYED